MKDKSDMVIFFVMFIALVILLAAVSRYKCNQRMIENIEREKAMSMPKPEPTSGDIEYYHGGSR